MSAPMKRPPTESVEVIVHDGVQNKFHLPRKKAKALLTLLEGFRVDERGEDDLIPADQVFKDEIAKYTKPGLALRGARLKGEMSQVKLAERLGISQTDLSKMEYGKRPIGKKMARRLSKMLHIDYRIFL